LTSFRATIIPASLYLIAIRFALAKAFPSGGRGTTAVVDEVWLSILGHLIRQATPAKAFSRWRRLWQRRHYNDQTPFFRNSSKILLLFV